jgi:Arc/MetJ-type ribon-helix-helix transcriptional regulator
MPTIQVTISAETEAILKQKIESGEYQSAGAVLEAGLGLLIMNGELGESGKEKTVRISRLRDELEQDIRKPDFSVEEYERYLDRCSQLDDETKLELLRLAIDEADESPNAEPGVFERLRSYIDEVAEEKAKCPTTN